MVPGFPSTGALKLRPLLAGEQKAVLLLVAALETVGHRDAAEPAALPRRAVLEDGRGLEDAGVDEELEVQRG